MCVSVCECVCVCVSGISEFGAGGGCFRCRVLMRCSVQGVLGFGLTVGFRCFFALGFRAPTIHK